MFDQDQVDQLLRDTAEDSNGSPSGSPAMLAAKRVRTQRRARKATILASIAVVAMLVIGLNRHSIPPTLPTSDVPVASIQLEIIGDEQLSIVLKDRSYLLIEKEVGNAEIIFLDRQLDSDPKS